MILTNLWLRHQRAEDVTPTFYPLVPEGTSVNIATTTNLSGWLQSVAAAVNGFTPLDAPAGEEPHPSATATAASNSLTIQMRAIGSLYNGSEIHFSIAGDTWYASPARPVLEGGADEDDEQTPSAPRPYSPGTFVRAYKRKMIGVGGNFVYMSGIDQPTQWTPDADGADIRDMMNQTGGNAYMEGMAEYQQYVAFFGREQIQVWFIDPDPAKDQLVQTLQSIGTTAPKSVVQYGSGDVFFLANSGIRSLRARDSSNSAYAMDVGHAIDELVKERRAEMPDSAKVIGLMEPEDGRLWMILGGEIFVLSYFTSSKINAWTRYETGIDIVDAGRNSDRAFVRDADTIYAYGGLDGTEYDATPARVRTPYLNANAPGTFKMLEAVDIACQGTWQVRGFFDPTMPDVSDQLATVSKSTHSMQRIAVAGEVTHFSIQAVSQGAGYARLGSLAVHYSETEGR